MTCHKDIYDDHIQTAHFLSSQASDETSIAGSFEPGKNSFSFTDIGKVAMEKRSDGFYQVEYLGGREGRNSKFDITIGSGKKGQSYLSWKGHSLIQMPVTYFTPEKDWSSSPGFDPRKIRFDRVVTSRCLECHTTYVETTSPPNEHPETYNREQLILGIDCEKCHGPAKEHVDFHTQHPGEKQGRNIVNTGKMSRQLSLDLCGLCHTGSLTKTKPSFTFQAGDSLVNYFTRSNINVMINGQDVHGNQLGMLSQSKCFTASSMSCQSCHSAHKKEQEMTEVYSQRCRTCHAEGKTKLCGLLPTTGPIINNNCIDCHMPKLPSQSIVVFLEGQDRVTPAKLRTHFIGIYESESGKVLDTLKRSKLNLK